MEEGASDEGNMNVVLETKVIDNCELMFPSWYVRMKKRRTSSKKEKELMGVKAMLSGNETTTNWSWD